MSSKGQRAFDLSRNSFLASKSSCHSPAQVPSFQFVFCRFRSTRPLPQISPKLVPCQLISRPKSLILYAADRSARPNLSLSFDSYLGPFRRGSASIPSHTGQNTASDTLTRPFRSFFIASGLRDTEAETPVVPCLQSEPFAKPRISIPF